MDETSQYRRDITEEETQEVKRLIGLRHKPDEIQKWLLERGLAPDFAEYTVKDIKKEKRAASRKTLCRIIAAPFFAIGALLIIGNVTGLFPTFPLAGYLTMSVGGVVTWLGEALDY